MAICFFSTEIHSQKHKDIDPYIVLAVINKSHCGFVFIPIEEINLKQKICFHSVVHDLWKMEVDQGK